MFGKLLNTPLPCSDKNYTAQKVSVFRFIQAKCGKIGTRIIPNTNTLHGVLASNVDFRLRSQYDLNSFYVISAFTVTHITRYCLQELVESRKIVSRILIPMSKIKFISAGVFRTLSNI